MCHVTCSGAHVMQFNRRVSQPRDALLIGYSLTAEEREVFNGDKSRGGTRTSRALDNEDYSEDHHFRARLLLLPVFPEFLLLYCSRLYDVCGI